jgi:ketosteroid isomerase-like protein
MENLARLAYSRKSLKRLTRVFATDKEACVEYLTVVSTAGEVSDFEREHGLHGIDISNAKPTVDTFELPVCFVCEIQDGKIRRAREYWDAASLARQLGAPGHQHDSEAPSSQDRSR